MQTNKLFDYAELAEASYVKFDKIDFLDEDREGQIKKALMGKIEDSGGGFSATQAADFVAKWEMAVHLPDTDSGFSATVFPSQLMAH